MHPLRTPRIPALLALAAVALAACGEPGPSEPGILSFSSDMESVEVGHAVTLAWETRDALTLALTGADGAAVALDGQALDAGAVTVTLDTVGSHTFLLVASGAEGTTPAEASVTVEATAPPAPAITEFAATPAAIPLGGDTTLSWSVDDAVTIAVRAGESVLAEDTTGAGSVTVSPTVDTTYTLVATGRGGDEVSSDVTVIVHQPPTVDRFVILDEHNEPVTGAILGGASVTLTWETSGADAVSLVDAEGTTLEATEVDGSLVLVPERSTTYTLTATGPGGSTSADASVGVLAVVQAFTAAAEGEAPATSITVRPGDEITLSWTTHGATAATLVGPEGPLAVETVQQGSLTVTASVAGQYHLSLEPAGIFSEAMVQVGLTDAPRIRSLTATPNPVSEGAPVSLAWRVDGADALSITAVHTDADVPSVAATDLNLAAGTASLLLPVAGDWTVTAEATNGVSPESHTRQVVVDVRAAPEIVSFAARPARTVSGSSVTLAWETLGAETTRLLRDGVEVAGFPGTPTGTFSDVIVTEHDYRLVADNGVGVTRESSPVTVTVGDPEVVSFAADRHFYAPESEVTLTWQNLGGRSLQVVDLASGTPVPQCTLVDAYERIASGSCTFPAPTLLGEATYQLQVTDGGSTATRDLTLEVIDGPVVRSFRASTDLLTAGAALTFFAQVDRSLDGEAPTLELIDQYGTRYNVLTWDETTGAVEGTLLPTAARDYVFTLVASAPGTSSSQASVDVTVVPPPVIDEYYAENPYIESTGGTVQASRLIWFTRDAVRVSLSLEGADTPFFTSEDPAAIASFAYEVSPDVTTRYVLVAENVAGSVDTAVVEVGVDFPFFVSLEGTNAFGDAGRVVNTLVDDGDPATLSDVVTLSWVTQRADRVLFSRPVPTVTETSGAILATQVDPGLSEVTDLGLSNQTDLATLDLPFGVAFYGQVYDSVVVSATGWVSFDTGSGSDYGNSRIPSTNDPRALVSVFHDDIAPGATGVVWTARGTDPVRGDYVIVQWSGFQFDSSSYNPASLNFQVKLFATGDFEFTYGTMEGSGTYGPRYAKGYSATVGFQDWDRTFGYLYAYGEQVILPGQRLFFDFPELGPEGSLPVSTDQDEQAFILTAMSDVGASSETVTVVTWADLAKESGDSFALDLPAQVGSPVAARWDIQDATWAGLFVDGVSVCENTAPRDNLSGCEWTPSAEGEYQLELRYSNPVSQGSVARTVQVETRVAIESFFANGETNLVLGGAQPVVLTWDVTNAVELDLLDARGRNLLEVCPDLVTTQTCTVTPSASTHYELYATDVPGYTNPDRIRYAKVTVTFSDTRVDAFEVSRHQTWEGGSVDVSWQAASSAADAQFTLSPPTSTRTGVPFQTLVGDLNASRVSRDSTDPLEDVAETSGMGFTFPFEGQYFTTFGVSERGYVNVGTDRDLGESAPDAIPEVDGHSGFVAPYWVYTSTYKRDPYQLYKVTGAPGNRSLVIEWVDHLNYGDGIVQVQLALFDDGRMEFRYGDFLYEDPTSAYDYRYLHGQDVAVGWESFTETSGFQLLVDESRPDLLAPGIVHTLFPPQTGKSGQREYTLVNDTEFEFCASGDRTSQCRTESVAVVHPGDVLITELMVNPAPLADTDGEWVELRNASKRDLDLQGWVLSDGVGSFTFPEGSPVVLESGAYLVVARGAASVNGGIETPWVWTDPGLDLDDVADTLTLTYGPMVVDRVAWDGAGDWRIAAGQSMTLDPSVHTYGESANDSWLAVDDNGVLDLRWCAAAAADSYAQGLSGSPGTTGLGCRFETYDLDALAHRTHGFVDIRDTGMPLPLAGKNLYTAVPSGLGFPVDYFGRTLDALWVSSNGWLTLRAADPGDSFPVNRAIPYYHVNNASPSGTIAVFWDDLEPRTDVYGRVTSKVHVQTLGTAPERVTVVQWTGWDSAYTGIDVDMTFQAQIHENGDIVFAYDTMDILSFDVDAPGKLRGDSASIGIEHVNDQSGVVHSYNRDYAVTPGQVIRFRHR